MIFTFRYFRIYLKALFKLVRWPNLALVFFTQYLVFVYIIRNMQYGPFIFWPTSAFWILSSGTMLVAAAGYIINDYYDIKIDLVNKPGRIVIGKLISRRQALLFHSVLNFTAIMLGFTLSWKVALYFASCASLLWLYSNYLKRTPLAGNIVVSVLTAATIWIISLYYRDHNHLLYIYSVFAFFISLLREIIKDIEDKKGDANYGCKTLPIVLGVRKTKILLFFILSLFGLLLVRHFQQISSGFSLYLSYLLFLPSVYLAIKLLLADKQKDYIHLSLFCKWYMVAGVSSLGFL